MQKVALYTAAVIFAAGTIGHVVRLINNFEIVIAGIVLPQWVSFPALLVGALLAIWMAVAAQRA